MERQSRPGSERADAALQQGPAQGEGHGGLLSRISAVRSQSFAYRPAMRRVLRPLGPCGTRRNLRPSPLSPSASPCVARRAAAEGPPQQCSMVALLLQLAALDGSRAARLRPGTSFLPADHLALWCCCPAACISSVSWSHRWKLLHALYVHVVCLCVHSALRGRQPPGGARVLGSPRPHLQRPPHALQGAAARAARGLIKGQGGAREAQYPPPCRAACALGRCHADGRGGSAGGHGQQKRAFLASALVNCAKGARGERTIPVPFVWVLGGDANVHSRCRRRPPSGSVHSRDRGSDALF